MVARYKRKRHSIAMSCDGHTKFLKLEGSERGYAKKEVKQGIEDTDWDNDSLIRFELAMEEEMKLANECYQKQLADPENHECTCPDPFKDLE